MKPHFPELFRKRNMQESKEEGRHLNCDFGPESTPMFQHLSPWLKECSQAAVLNLHQRKPCLTSNVEGQKLIVPDRTVLKGCKVVD